MGTFGSRPRVAAQEGELRPMQVPWQLLRASCAFGQDALLKLVVLAAVVGIQIADYIRVFACKAVVIMSSIVICLIVVIHVSLCSNR